MKILSIAGSSSQAVADVLAATKIEKIKIIKADLTSLPFEDEKFDFILCSHVIEHIEEPSNIIPFVNSSSSTLSTV